MSEKIPNSNYVNYLIINGEQKVTAPTWSLFLKEEKVIMDMILRLKGETPELQNFKAPTLKAWKLCVPRDYKRVTEEFLNAIQLVDEVPVAPNLEDFAVRLWPGDSIDACKGLTPGVLHLLIQHPEEDGQDYELFRVQDSTSEASGRCTKRPKLDDEDTKYSYVKRARMFWKPVTAPSSLDKPPNWEKLQSDPTTRILDDCPKVDASIPPLPLLYEGFGLFRDEADRRDGEYEMELMKDVDELCEAARFLGPEIEERELAQPILRRLLFPEDCQLPFSTSVGGKGGTDGHKTGPHRGPLLIVEWKRTVTVAEPQMCAHFFELVFNVDTNILLSWRFPCLGIIVRGACISFHGIIMVDSQLRCIPITEIFPCNDSELNNRTRLYAAFSAARTLLRRLESDAREFERKSPGASSWIPLQLRRLPNISRITHTSREGFVHFKMIDRFGEPHDGRWIYMAETINKNGHLTNILVKFTRYYSQELHEVCAKKGYAPKLYGIDKLPGGWFCVAMEYISGAKHPNEVEITEETLQAWLGRMEDIMNTMHSEGFVHGDLRLPNFLVKDDTLYVIDFDWGGKESEARFPPKLLNEVLQAGQKEAGQRTLITKVHDRFVLDCSKKALMDTFRSRHASSRTQVQVQLGDSSWSIQTNRGQVFID